MGDALRRRAARISWWLARRPATARSLRGLRLGTVARTGLARRFARLRTRLTRSSGLGAIGASGVRRAVRGVGRASVRTPVGFPQDTDGLVHTLGRLSPDGPSDRDLRRLRRRGVVRLQAGAERPAVTLAGGTPLLERDRLRELGGWPPARAGADKLLIDAVLAEGGMTYRTHGFQFILRRRPPSQAGGHTWSAPDDYFLADAVERRAGRDLGFADIDRVG